MVIQTIPVHGFVVVDPETSVGKSLHREWNWKERPGRYFVSVVFVRECLGVGHILPVSKWDGLAAINADFDSEEQQYDRVRWC